MELRSSCTNTSINAGAIIKNIDITAKSNKIIYISVMPTIVDLHCGNKTVYE